MIAIMFGSEGDESIDLGGFAVVAETLAVRSKLSMPSSAPFVTVSSDAFFLEG